MATTVNQPIYGAVTSTDKASEYRIYFAKKLLEHQVDKLQLYQYAYPAEIPKGEGSKTMRMFRAPPANISNVITLTEGTPPTAAPYKLIFEFVTRSLQQYGGYAQVSDIVDETEFLNTGDALMEKFGEEAALWCDTLIRDACIMGSVEEPTKFGRMYAGTATDWTTLGALTGATGRFSGDDLIDAVTKLRVQKAKEFSDGTYVAVVSPEQERDLIEEQGSAWVYASSFNKPDQIWKGEIGTLSGIKVVRATNPCYQTSGGTEGTFVPGGAVIAALVFGKDAFAAPKLSGENPPKPKVYTITQPDSANPFGQFSTYVWKTFYNAVCLSTWNGIVLQTKTAYTGT
jgi:N4-gp56 family major capsid protein